MLDVALLARGKSAPEISPVRLMRGEGFRLIVLNHGRERPLQAVILDAGNKAAENFGAWLISPHKRIANLSAGPAEEAELRCGDGVPPNWSIRLASAMTSALSQPSDVRTERSMASCHAWTASACQAEVGLGCIARQSCRGTPLCPTKRLYNETQERSVDSMQRQAPGLPKTG